VRRTPGSASAKYSARSASVGDSSVSTSTMRGDGGLLLRQRGQPKNLQSR
jgi:hypothetical protein